MKPYYADDLITIYHGDCLDAMAALHISDVDLVFTSPPYNLGVTTGGGFAADGKKTGKWSGGALKDGYGDYDDALPYGEYVAWQKNVLAACWETLSPVGAIFYNHKPRVQASEVRLPLALNPGLPIRQIIIWDRGSGMNFAPTHFLPMHEWIMVFGKPGFRLKSKEASGSGDVWRIPPQTGSPHPAPFPIALPGKAIEATAPSLVFDPFSGSGTTLRAAKDAGVQAIGVERDERWCQHAAERMGQESLFGAAA